MMDGHSAQDVGDFMLDNDVGLTEHVPRDRTKTLRRSCESCRASKARCIVESVAPQQQRRCKRCIDSGNECIFENTIARPKKLKVTARTRVKNVEDKLDNLIALISSQPGQEPGRANPPEALKAPETPSTISLPFQLDPPAPSPIAFDFLGSELCVRYPQDFISKGMLSEETAAHYVADFIHHPERFPFVVLRPNQSLDHLRRERPCLLLAVCVISSDVPTRKRLTLEFRKMISQALIVELQKSIDLLQGLIVFCAWHHRYYSKTLTSAYRLSQLAVSMILDLGYPNLGSLLTGYPDLSPVVSKQMQGTQYWQEIEKIRTFLGCYYVSSSLSLAYRRPRALKHDKYIEDGCSLLSRAQDTPTDYFLPYMLRLRSIAEDVDRIFQYSDPSGPAKMDEIRTEQMIQSFIQQVDQFRESLPPEAWNNATISLTTLYLPVHITQISILTFPTANATPGRLSLALGAIRAAQSFIAHYLSQPAATLRGLTMLDVFLHADAVLILSQATHPSLARAADIGRYLVESERRMTDLVVEPGDHFVLMSDVFRGGREAYELHLGGGEAVDGAGLATAFKLALSRALSSEELPGTDPDPPVGSGSGSGGDAAEVAAAAAVAASAPWGLPGQGVVWPGMESAGSPSTMWFEQ